MNKIRRLCICLFLITFGGVSLAKAADIPETASAAATELSMGLRKSLGSKARRIFLAPLVINPKNADVAVVFSSALQKALSAGQRLDVVDHSSVRGSVGDGSARFSEREWMEVAGAMGMDVLVSGNLEPSEDGFIANLRIINVKNGAAVVSSVLQFTANRMDLSVEAKNLDAQLRRLTDRLALGLDRLDGDAAYQRFAVLPLAEEGERSAQNKLGVVMAGQIAGHLVKRHGLMMVSRDQINALSRTSQNATNDISAQAAMDICRKLGTQGIIVGKVTDTEHSFVVQARVLSGIDGNEIIGDETQLAVADTVVLAQNARELRTTAGAVWRSALLPGWGQFYQHQNVKGIAFVSSEVIALSMATVFQLLGHQSEQDFQRLNSSSSPEEFSRLKSEAENRYKGRNAALWVAAGIYAFNIVDAWVNGSSSN